MTGAVESWRIEPGVGVVINGEVFPYWVLAAGPMVEQIEGFEDRHILWLPLIADGPVPRIGRPDGEPAPEAHNRPLSDEQAEGGPEDARQADTRWNEVDR